MKTILHLIRKDAQALAVAWSLWVLVVAAQVGVAVRLGGHPRFGLVGASLAVVDLGAVATSGFVLARGRVGRFGRSAAWGLCVLSGSVLAAILGYWLTPETSDLQVYQAALLYFNLLGAVWMLGAFILAASSILQDPVVGSDAFWATRPISGGRLLSAKIIGIAVFLVLIPPVIWLPWRIYCSFDLGDLLLTSLQTLGLSAVIVLPAIVLAALSGTVARFLVYVLVSLLAVFSLGLTVSASMRAGSGLTISRTVACVLVIAIAAVAAVIAQYLYRRWARSISILLAGVAVGTFVGCLLSFDWYDRLPSGRSPTIASQVQFSKPKFRLSRGYYSSDNTLMEDVSFDVSVSGLPEGVVCGDGHIDVRLLWPSGEEVYMPKVDLYPSNPGLYRAVAHLLNLPATARDAETDAEYLRELNARRAKSGKLPLKSLEERFHEGGIGSRVSDDAAVAYSARFTLDGATTQKMLVANPSIQVILTLDLAHPVVAFEMPFDTGQRRFADGLMAEVISHDLVNLSPDTNNKPVSFLRAWISLEYPAGSSSKVYCVTRGQPFAGLGEAGSSLRTVGGGPDSLFEGLDRMQVGTRVPIVWRGDHWQLDKEWADRTSIAVVRLFSDGAIRREFTMEVSPSALQR